jgi:hypothetical protein
LAVDSVASANVDNSYDVFAERIWVVNMYSVTIQIIMLLIDFAHPTMLELVELLIRFMGVDRLFGTAAVLSP